MHISLQLLDLPWEADSTLEVTPTVGAAGAAAAAVVKALALALAVITAEEASLGTWRPWQVSPVGSDQRAGGPGGVNFC